MININKIANESILQWAFLVIIIALAALLRFSSLSFEYDHPDEVIAVEVSRHVISNATLDTNWINVNLPSFFKNNQYNFSGYLLTSSAFLIISSQLSILSDFTELELLRGFSATFGVLTVFMTFILGRQLFGACAGLIGACIASATPLLYQDSLYARPETFFTALTLFYIYLLGKSEWSRFKRLATAAFVMGILIATKISAAALIPLIFFPATGQTINKNLIQQGLAQFPHTLAMVFPALIAGFFVAAPFALLNIDNYLDGYYFLSRQYNSGHWPHGLPNASHLERLSSAANYFISTNGILLFISAVTGLIFCIQHKMTREVLVFSIIVIYSLRFGSYPTFFERNFSHIFPVYCIFSAYGITSISGMFSKNIKIKFMAAIILAGLVIYPELLTTYKIRFIELNGEQEKYLSLVRDKVESDWGLESMKPASSVTDHAYLKSIATDKCGPSLIEFPLFGDLPSALILRSLMDTYGYTEAGRLASVFENTPPSTLHTYFTPTTVFIFKDAEIKNCRSGSSMHVRKQNSGHALPVDVTYMDTGWTRGGAYGQPSDPFGNKSYFGSWSGADNNTGRVRIELEVAGHDYFVLPYITGPVSGRQSIIISSKDSGAVIFSMQPSPTATGWKYLLVRVPEGAERLLVDAEDQGAAWGEWLAISNPRSYKNLTLPARPERIIEKTSR